MCILHVDIAMSCLSTAIKYSYTEMAACQPAHHMQTPMRVTFAIALSDTKHRRERNHFLVYPLFI